MQTSFSEYEYASKKRQTRRGRFLAEIEAMTPRGELVAAIERHYPKEVAVGGRRSGWSAWCACTSRRAALDFRTRKLEDAIYDSQTSRRSVGIDPGRETAPCATTLLKFSARSKTSI